MQKSIVELDLKKYLEEFSHTKVDFYRFPGNYGDSLIYHGTKTLLDGLNISINLVEIDSDICNEILFIDGGGNFVDEYNDVYNFLSKKHDKYKRIVLLPHTIYGEKQSKFLPSLGSNVTIFCREKFSYKFVKENTTKAECYLWHDCAFYNDITKYIGVGEGVLNAFRVDIESNKRNLTDDNEDISFNGWCMKLLPELLEKIAKYEEIKTDRLHVAIAAAMLGKRVILFPNSYYKNMAVYEYSLKKYSDVVFIYENDKDFISYKNLSVVFQNYLNSGENEEHHNVYDLLGDLIHLNHRLWKYEDQVRNVNSSDKSVREAKQNIDKFNQLRNDTIRKIDFNMFYLLNNSESTDFGRYISESPGMFTDRLSIMFIRRFEIQRLISTINDDSSLLEIYNQKLRIIMGQLDFNGRYFDLLISSIKNKTVFFKIFDAIKIYNDPRIKKYINKPK